MLNRGKEFEQKVKQDFLKIPGSHLERLYDSMGGYKSIKTRSDFIGYIYPNQYFLEVKSVHGNTFPFTNLKQYNGLLEVSGIHGIRSGVIIWFVDHQIVCYVPVRTIKQMKQEGLKSVNVKYIKEGSAYRIINIPSKARKIFLDSNYSILTTLADGE